MEAGPSTERFFGRNFPNAGLARLTRPAHGPGSEQRFLTLPIRANLRGRRQAVSRSFFEVRRRLRSGSASADDGGLARSFCADVIVGLPTFGLTVARLGGRDLGFRQLLRGSRATSRRKFWVTDALPPSRCPRSPVPVSVKALVSDSQSQAAAGWKAAAFSSSTTRLGPGHDVVGGAAALRRITRDELAGAVGGDGAAQCAGQTRCPI